MLKRKHLRPKTGWRPREVLDAAAIDADAEFNCDFCGRRLRWVHVIEHERYREPMQAGYRCADRRCFDYDAADAERQFKNKASRRRRFVDRSNWNNSKTKDGNIWRWVPLPDGRERLTVWVTPEGYYGIFLCGHNHWPKYVTQDAAMNAAFDWIEQLKEEATV